MQTTLSPELRGLREQVEAALIVAGQNARELAEQTGTRLVVVESSGQPVGNSGQPLEKKSDPVGA